VVAVQLLIVYRIFFMPVQKRHNLSSACQPYLSEPALYLPFPFSLK
jgi:hypothetical protein